MRILGLVLGFITIAFTAAVGLAKPHHWDIARAHLSDLIPATAITADPVPLPGSDWSKALIAAARAQIGVTTIYDGAYQGLSYPGGDVPRERGVCTDVVIRALRDAHDIDLQQLVHDDMRSAFSSYPANWGLKRPDRNIDHRRVPNLRRYFKRLGLALPPPDAQSRFLPGDIVTWTLGPNLPHIGVVSDQLAPGTSRPLIVHNVGAGTRLEDFLLRYPMTGHYRLDGRF